MGYPARHWTARTPRLPAGAAPRLGHAGNQLAPSPTSRLNPEYCRYGWPPRPGKPQPQLTRKCPPPARRAARLPRVTDGQRCKAPLWAHTQPGATGLQVPPACTPGASSQAARAWAGEEFVAVGRDDQARRAPAARRIDQASVRPLCFLPLYPQLRAGSILTDFTRASNPASVTMPD